MKANRFVILAKIYIPDSEEGSTSHHASASETNQID